MISFALPKYTLMQRFRQSSRNKLQAENDSFETTVRMFSASRLRGKKPLPIEMSMCLITKFGEVDNKCGELVTICAMHRGKDLIPNN